MPVVESYEQLKSMVMEDTVLSHGAVYLLVLADQLSPGVYPFQRTERWGQTQEEDRECFKRLYEKEGLSTYDIGQLTSWHQATIATHVELIDRRRVSKLHREANELKKTKETLYFKTDKLNITDEGKEIGIGFPHIKFTMHMPKEEKCDISLFFSRPSYLGYIIEPGIELFYSPSRGHVGLTVDGFMAKYIDYTVELFQNVMGSIGLDDVLLVER